MSIEEAFSSKFERNTTMKPIPCKLAMGSNGDFYWFYYAGMGETNYHKLPDFEQPIVNSLLAKKTFIISDEVQTISVINEQSLSEIVFKIITKP